jgi:hypothetical protein
MVMRDVQAASLLLLLKMAAAAGGQQRHQRTCPLSAYPALSKKSIVCKRKRHRHHHFTFLGLFEKRLRLLLPLLPKHTPPSLATNIRGLQFHFNRRAANLMTKVTSGAFLGLGFGAKDGVASRGGAGAADEERAAGRGWGGREGVGGREEVEAFEAAEEAREATLGEGMDGREWAEELRDAAAAAAAADDDASVAAAAAAADDDDATWKESMPAAHISVTKPNILAGKTRTLQYPFAKRTLLQFGVDELR